MVCGRETSYAIQREEGERRRRPGSRIKRRGNSSGREGRKKEERGRIYAVVAFLSCSCFHSTNESIVEGPAKGAKATGQHSKKAWRDEPPPLTSILLAPSREVVSHRLHKLEQLTPDIGRDSLEG